MALVMILPNIWGLDEDNYKAAVDWIINRTSEEN